MTLFDTAMNLTESLFHSIKCQRDEKVGYTWNVSVVYPGIFDPVFFLLRVHLMLSLTLEIKEVDLSSSSTLRTEDKDYLFA